MGLGLGCSLGTHLITITPTKAVRVNVRGKGDRHPHFSGAAGAAAVQGAGLPASPCWDQTARGGLCLLPPLGGLWPDEQGVWQTPARTAVAVTSVLGHTEAPTFTF